MCIYIVYVCMCIYIVYMYVCVYIVYICMCIYIYIKSKGSFPQYSTEHAFLK